MTRETSLPKAAALILLGLVDDMLRRDFVTPEFERAVKPVIGVEGGRWELARTPEHRVQGDRV